jgi:arylsulfatase A-like enzyme
MISGIDIMIGRVLKTLRAQGLADNTIVIYAADNGLFMGERGLSGKWNHFEQSLRVPLIIYDPRVPPAQRGRVMDQMALNIDLAPTILDYAGVPLPRHYQGRSLAPLVRGDKNESWRSEFLCEHLVKDSAIPQWEGVRTHRFIYARYFGQTPPYEFLHDLAADPDELMNLATNPSHQDIRNDLRARCDALIAQCVKDRQTA